MSSKVACKIVKVGKELYVLNPKGDNVKLEPNDELHYEITDDMMKFQDTTPINEFEREIQDILSLEEQIKFYRHCGRAVAIIISNTAMAVGIAKSDVKIIIGIGAQLGIFYQGNNNTWRMHDPATVKDRWEKKAVEYERGPVKEESQEERIEKLRKRGLIGGGHDSKDDNIVDDRPTHSKEFVKARKSMDDLLKKTSGQPAAVIMSEKPLIDQSEAELRVRLSYLQNRLATHKEWTELETQWMVNDEIHRVKAQLRGYDAKNNSLNLPRSVTQVMDEDTVKVDIAPSENPSQKTIGTKTTSKTLKKRPSK